MARIKPAATTPRAGTILVIDDEPGPRESLRFLFKNEYDVRCADSVQAGLVELMSRPIDVVVLDIRMPDKTGLDGLREIRGLDAHVSIIMLTGYGNLATAQEAIRLGATDYLTKPFEMKAMRDAVAAAVTRTLAAREQARTIRELEALTEQLSAQMAAREHLASLGEASSEFVHDLRNPLTVIQGYIELVTQQLRGNSSHIDENPEHVLGYLDIVSASVKRCQDMARDWRSLVRKNPARMRPCRVSDLVDEVTQDIVLLVGRKGGRLEIDRGDEEAEIMAERAQFVRAVENLLSNAVEALPDAGGLIRIGWHAAGSRVVIRIEDNGHGLPPAAIDQVFQPSFTTKTGGMGIGLYIARRIVEMYEGEIRLENRPQGGAVATVALPLHQPQTAAGDSPDRAMRSQAFCLAAASMA